MTDQVNLDLIWADTGGVIDPGDIKYTTGWITEIPTYENFNFVLQNHSKNQLALAERAGFEWETSIAYLRGAVVVDGDRTYYCHLANTGNQPSTDSTNSYWRASESWGAAHTYSAKAGAVSNVMFQRGGSVWLGQEATLINTENSFILFADNSIRTNILLGISNGELVTKSVGNVVEPDGQDIHPDGGGSRIFHESHPPIQSEVAGTIPEAPSDSFIYGRGTGAWHQVATVDEVAKLKPFPTGTRMLFAQASAPDTWVQDTSDTANNRMLRVVTDIGGGVGGTNTPILNDKVPSHTHEVGVSRNDHNHNHTFSDTSTTQSANHSHYTNLTSANNNKTHTHGSGTYKTDTAPNHTHGLGDTSHTDVGGGKLTTGSAVDFVGAVTAGGGAHSHDVTGTTGSQSTNHTHTVTGNTGSNNANHTHSVSGTTGFISSEHAHLGLCEYNRDGSFTLDTQVNGTGGTETRSNDNTGDWAPKYVNIIICTAN